VEKRAGGIRGLISGHPRLTGAVVFAAIALAVFGFLWFRPDKLIASKTVNEAAPLATGSAAVQSPVVSSASFRSLEHPTRGTAKIVRLADGSHVVRLENFKTSAGPDVVVMLSDTPATENDWRAYDDGAILLLGNLKGTAGNQNYGVPAGTEVAKYRSVVIWCRRFLVGFGAAAISV
jgi:hypothetical protein